MDTGAKNTIVLLLVKRVGSSVYNEQTKSKHHSKPQIGRYFKNLKLSCIFLFNSK